MTSNQKMSPRALATNTALAAFAHIVSRGAALLTIVILSQNLEPNQLASYSLFQLTSSMLATYATLGLGITATRYFAETATNEEPPVGALWTLSILAAASVAAITLIIPGEWIGNSISLSKWMLATCIFFIAAATIPNGALAGLELYKESIYLTLTPSAILLIGALIASTNKAVDIAIWAVLATTILQTTATSLLILHVLKKKKVQLRFRISRKEIHQITAAAGPMLGVSILAASATWVCGRILLSTADGPKHFTMYAIGLQWYALTLFIPGVVSRVLLPRIIHLKNQNQSAQALTLQGAKVATYIALATALLGILASPILTQAYGKDYMEQHWVLIAFLVAAIPAAPANTIGNFLVAHDHQKLWLVLTAIWCGTLIASIKVLSETGAIAGAAAHAIASTILTAISLHYLRSKRSRQ